MDDFFDEFEETSEAVPVIGNLEIEEEYKLNLENNALKRRIMDLESDVLKLTDRAIKDEKRLKKLSEAFAKLVDNRNFLKKQNLDFRRIINKGINSIFGKFIEINKKEIDDIIENSRRNKSSKRLFT